MITRMKNKQTGIRYLSSPEALEIGREYVVSSGPAAGQKVRPTASLQKRIAGPNHYYDFEAVESGKWYPANPTSQGICPDCGEPRVICECGCDGF